MTTRHFLVALCLLVAAAVEAKHLVKRQVFPPQPRGPVDCSRGGLVPDPSDCSRYYDCNYGGQGVLMSCLSGLNFNPNGQNGAGSCDYPGTFTQTSNCVDTNPRNLKNSVLDLCRPDNGVNPDQAFLRAHPTLCNAFYMCNAAYIQGPCTVCAEGTFFRQGGTTCEAYSGYSRNASDVRALACPDGSQRTYVRHVEVVQTRLGLECSVQQ